ncbi:hypothetical protein HDU81_000297 [Chytriomyces hyalinus]|nr:hypothetical protein HDU81_000297 [Chytriomyces hyalinus]
MDMMRRVVMEQKEFPGGGRRGDDVVDSVAVAAMEADQQNVVDTEVAAAAAVPFVETSHVRTAVDSNDIVSADIVAGEIGDSKVVDSAAGIAVVRDDVAVVGTVVGTVVEFRKEEDGRDVQHTNPQEVKLKQSRKSVRPYNVEFDVAVVPAEHVCPYRHSNNGDGDSNDGGGDHMG